MILYHWTPKQNLKSIMKEGLRTNGFGIVYLSKYPDIWKRDNHILLKVKVPEDLKLTVFEEYKDGSEILCWGEISKENITIK